MCNQKSKNNKLRTSGYSGVALVAVLAVLVILSILAASFSTMMNLELKQSNEQHNSYQLDMLTEAGFEHAKTLLWTDDVISKTRNSVMTIAGSFFAANGKNKYSKWFYVKDELGKYCGRYRINIEDEAGKVNINKARLQNNSKGYGWDTGEVNLPRALGVPYVIAKNVLKYRYGSNLLPGARGDDDHNNVLLMADGIDNNANGVVDEEDEGLNDPGEYKANHLMGDDRKFSTINEVASILLNTKKALPLSTISNIREKIPHRATIYSCDMPGSSTLQNKFPSDINCITTRECRNLLMKANADVPFEPNSAKQMQLAANLIDYRDENHVLSTLGSTYGVEAICFNEVLANDETYSVDPSYAFAPWLDNDKDYWIDNCGSEDGKRMFYFVDMIYDALPDDPQYSYIIDPRRAWRINKEKRIGELKYNENNLTIDFPKAIGKRGSSTAITPFISTPLPADLPGNKTWSIWHAPGAVVGSSRELENLHENLLNVLGKLGGKDGERPKFQKNYFKNSLAMIYKWLDNPDDNEKNKSIGCFEILAGDQNSITISKKEYYSGESFDHRMALANMDVTDYDLSVTINAWSPAYPIACVPRANRSYLLRSRRPVAGKYFKIAIGRPSKNRYTKGYPDDLGVSGKIYGKYTSDKDLTRQWVYNDGKPIRAKSGGWMEVMLTSSPEVKRDGDNKQYVSYFKVNAPEIIEMYNASATPVSLANWKVICNTGSEVSEIGVIHNTSYYDKKLRKSIRTDNPVVQPQGHFYLVNDTELFDANYGNANNKWGSTANEQIPVFQMDEQNWGVTYRIKRTKNTEGDGEDENRWGYSIIVDGNGLDKENFNLETVKFVDKENEDDPNSWNNLFAPVLSHFIYKKNEIFIRPIGDDKDIQSGKLVGKSIMVLGLPHSGGIVSLTLKNEYDQVCARTVDYGKVEVEDLQVSMEKIDPTKNTWIRRRKPSIGGTENKAENRAMRTHHDDKFFIKNGPFCSVGEVRNISTGNDFERLGAGGDVSKGITALRLLSKYMSSSYVRLESCLGNVTQTGWNKAYDEVAGASLKSVQAKSGGWKLNKWAGQTIRFLTGPLRGEKYPITSNSKNILMLNEKKSGDISYSSPNRKALKPNGGDKFSIGPGYATPMCYTRKSGEVGTWTWKNVISYPGTYDLYIYGLNDAIDTTEFFEENNNADIDVELWGGKHSGIAWFNYAVVTPVPVPGRVNINTAQPRLLASLPGINPKLAKNIFDGLDRHNKKTLKPYQNIGDILRVKGSTLDIFERCVNLLALDSTFFTVEVEAQLFKNNNFKEKNVLDIDSVIGTRIKRFVINTERQESGNVKIHELEGTLVR